jgi:hypothetical protein
MCLVGVSVYQTEETVEEFFLQKTKKRTLSKVGNLPNGIVMDDFGGSIRIFIGEDGAIDALEYLHSENEPLPRLQLQVPVLMRPEVVNEGKLAELKAGFKIE